MVAIISNTNNNSNNNNNLDNDSDSDMDIENKNKNIFDKDINDEVKASPKTTISAKVVQGMKSYKLCTMTMPTNLSSKL